MMTIKEFAEYQGISQAAVSKQIKKHAKELDGHIDRSNRPFLLDDEAVKILSKSRENLVVVQEKTDSRIKYLMEENSALKSQIIELQNRLISCNSEISQLKIDKVEMEKLIEMNKIEERSIFNFFKRKKNKKGAA